MEKNEVLLTLQNAVRSHKQWVGNAFALIEGAELDKEKVPLNATECAFGRWYYGDGQKMKKISGFRELEPLHDKLHKTYMEIFGILFGESSEPSFFHKMLGLSRKVAAANREAAMERYHVLERQSEAVVKQIEQLEKVITAMGEKQLAIYFA
jgi:hypothetical protein